MLVEHLTWEYQLTSMIIITAQNSCAPPQITVNQMFSCYTTVTTIMHIVIDLAKSQLVNQQHMVKNSHISFPESSYT